MRHALNDPHSLPPMEDGTLICDSLLESTVVTALCTGRYRDGGALDAAVARGATLTLLSPHVGCDTLATQPLAASATDMRTLPQQVAPDLLAILLQSRALLVCSYTALLNRFTTLCQLQLEAPGVPASLRSSDRLAAAADGGALAVATRSGRVLLASLQRRADGELALSPPLPVDPSPLELPRGGQREEARAMMASHGTVSQVLLLRDPQPASLPAGRFVVVLTQGSGESACSRVSTWHWREGAAPATQPQAQLVTRRHFEHAAPEGAVVALASSPAGPAGVLLLIHEWGAVTCVQLQPPPAQGGASQAAHAPAGGDEAAALRGRGAGCPPALHGADVASARAVGGGGREAAAPLGDAAWSSCAWHDHSVDGGGAAVGVGAGACATLLVGTLTGQVLALPVEEGGGAGGGGWRLAPGRLLYAGKTAAERLAPLPGGRLLMVDESGALLHLRPAHATAPGSGDASPAAGATHSPSLVAPAMGPLTGCTVADLLGEGQPQVYASSAAPFGGVAVASAAAHTSPLAVSVPGFGAATGLWAMGRADRGGGDARAPALLVLSFAAASRAMAGGAGAADDGGSSTLVDVSDAIGIHTDEATLAAGMVAGAVAVQVTPSGVYLCDLEPLAAAGGLGVGARNVRHSPVARRREWGVSGARARRALDGAAAAAPPPPPGALSPLCTRQLRALALGEVASDATSRDSGSSGTPPPPPPGLPRPPLGLHHQTGGWPPIQAVVPGALAALAAPGAGLSQVAAPSPPTATASGETDNSSNSTGSTGGGAPLTAGAAAIEELGRWAWSAASWHPPPHSDARAQPGGAAVTLAAVTDGAAAVAVRAGDAHALVLLRVVRAGNGGGGAGAGAAVAAPIVEDTASSPPSSARAPRKRGRSHWHLQQAGHLELHHQLSCLQVAAAPGGPAECFWLCAGRYDGALDVLLVRAAQGGLLRVALAPSAHLHTPLFCQPHRGQDAGGGSGTPPAHSIAVLSAPPAAAWASAAAASAAAGAAPGPPPPPLLLAVGFRDGALRLVEWSGPAARVAVLSQSRLGSLPLTLQPLPPDPAASPPGGAAPSPSPREPHHRLLAVGEGAWLADALPASRGLSHRPLAVGARLTQAAALHLPLPPACAAAAAGCAAAAMATAAAAAAAPPPTADGVAPRWQQVLIGTDEAGQLHVRRLPSGAACCPNAAGASGYRATATLLPGHNVHRLCAHTPAQALLALVTGDEGDAEGGGARRRRGLHRWAPPCHGLICVSPATGQQLCLCTFRAEEALTDMCLWDTGSAAAAPRKAAPSAPPAPRAGAAGSSGGASRGGTAAAPAAAGGGDGDAAAAAHATAQQPGASPRLAQHCRELRAVFSRFVRLNMVPSGGAAATASGGGGGGGGAPSQSAQHQQQSSPAGAGAASTSGGGAGGRRRASADAASAPLAPLVAVCTSWHGEGGVGVAPPAVRGCVYVLQLACPAPGSPASAPQRAAGGGAWSLSLVTRLRMPDPVTALAQVGRHRELAVGVGCRVALYRLAARHRHLTCTGWAATCTRVVCLAPGPGAGQLTTVEELAGLVVRQLNHPAPPRDGLGSVDDAAAAERLAVAAADVRTRRLAAAGGGGGRGAPPGAALVLEGGGEGRVAAVAPRAEPTGPLPALEEACGVTLEAPAVGWACGDEGVFVPTLLGGVARAAWLPQPVGRVLVALQRAVLRHGACAPLGSASARGPGAATVSGALLRHFLQSPRWVRQQVLAQPQLHALLRELGLTEGEDCGEALVLLAEAALACPAGGSSSSGEALGEV